MRKPKPDPHLTFTKQFVTALPSLQGFLISLVHDTHAADDLMQDLAERMWLKFADYDDRRPFVAWGMGFARLLVKEWYRKQKRQPLQLDEQMIDMLADDASERLAHQDERVDALRSCIEKLSEKQRAVLRMRYQEEKPIKLIATEWNRSQVAIYKMLKQIHFGLLACISETMADHAR